MIRLGFNSKLREGDTVLVWKLDGIARSISHFLKLIGELDKRGVSFKRMKSWAGAKLKTSHSNNRTICRAV